MQADKSRTIPSNWKREKHEGVGLVVKSIMVTLSEGLVISPTNFASVSRAIKSTQKQDLSLPAKQTEFDFPSKGLRSEFPICGIGKYTEGGFWRGWSKRLHP